MKKKTNDSEPQPEKEWINQVDEIIRKKEIQNKVLKELIEKLKNHPESGKKESN